jgi:hypothetical protein
MGYTLVLSARNQLRNYTVVASSAIVCALAVLVLYMALGNSDYTLVGRALPGTQSNVRDGYFLLAKVRSVGDAVQVLWQETIAMRQALAPLLLGCLIAGLSMFGRRRQFSTPTGTYFVLCILELVAFVFTEGHFLRSQIYIAPVFALMLMHVWRTSIQTRSVLLSRALLTLSIPWTIIFFVRGSAAASVADRIVQNLKNGRAGVNQKIAAANAGGMLLLDTHTLGYFIDDSEDHPMGDLFLWHDARNERFTETFRRFNVKWALRICARGEPILNNRKDVDDYLRTHAKVVSKLPGIFSDLNTSYRLGTKADTEDMVLYELE